MDTQEVLALYDKEQRIEIEHPGTRKDVLPHVVRFVRPAPGANLIAYSRLNESNADAVIEEQIAALAPLNQPFSWKVHDYDTPPDLGERLVAHGFERQEPDAIMVLDLREAPAALLEPVTADVRPIRQRGQLADVIKVEEQVWGGSFAWIKQRLGDHLEIPGYLSVYVAYVEGQPVCSGWTYFYGNGHFAGLWGGSTVATYRKRGLYTAVLAVRVQEAMQRGTRYLTIDASAMSRPIVARHGFQLVAQACDYDWKGR
ncbi:MAG: N-acetyltransferase [Chloroflexi bacterium]|nr:N-acetyltransferase [Chloroflexota bacterium]MCI0575376.1 N-acetyltransferase [Chloroflexota bacterium]MCI0646376.1 N-acetyltransferase [Chloroflexota bacterium]MCI0728366.1 N-acetyltransferase [Chloroflexota bacterium]